MRGTFTLTVRLGNDAMQSHEDIGDLLRDTGLEMMGRYDSQDKYAALFDVNGNRVGEWRIS